MKNDPIYSYYLSYIKERLDTGRLSNGAYSLFRISKDQFEKFKFYFESDELFNKKIVELHKREMRDQKINDILNDSD